MSRSLNVLTNFPYTTRYYLKKPWLFFRDCGHNIRDAVLRMTRGYGKSDVWIMSDWMLAVLPPMLRELKNDPVGSYPGIEPFETPEKWDAWLSKTADRLELLQDDWAEDCMPNGDVKEWNKKIQELHQQQQELTNEVFTELGRYLYWLWS